MAFYYLSQRCAVRPRVQPDSENEGQGHEILEIFLINSKFFLFCSPAARIRVPRRSSILGVMRVVTIGNSASRQKEKQIVAISSYPTLICRFSTASASRTTAAHLWNWIFLSLSLPMYPKKTSQLTHKQSNFWNVRKTKWMADWNASHSVPNVF